MARPTIAQRPISAPLGARAQTRDLLLEAASVLMRERDSLDISLSEIAARAQLNSALVKYYFGNKQGLMIALLERDLTHVMPEMEALLMRRDMTPSRKMRAHILGIVGIYFSFPYLNRLMMEIIRDGSDAIAKHIADTYLKPINDFYEQVIAAGVAAGEFKPVDPALFYFTTIGACDPFMSARFVLKYVHAIDVIDDDLRNRYARQTASLILQGLLGDGAAGS